MSRLQQVKKKDIGQSPDALTFKGIQKSDNVTIGGMKYDPSGFEEHKELTLSSLKEFTLKSGVKWINVSGLHDSKTISQIGEILNIDSYLLTEVMDTYSRPKVVDFDNGLFVSLHILKFQEDHLIDAEKISILLNSNYLITFQEKPGDIFDPVRERIRSSRKRIINNGCDYLAYALIDVVIDYYNYILTTIGDEIEHSEIQLFEAYKESQLNTINELKREIHFIRKHIKPLKDNIIHLQKPELDAISKKVKVHYQELMTNINHAQEAADSGRDMLNDQLNLYQTFLTNKLNDVMKFLTIFSVIFIPLTFVAGIYGTNFNYIPELEYRGSYFIMLAVMVIIAIVMIIYFKKRKWI